MFRPRIAPAASILHLFLSNFAKSNAQTGYLDPIAYDALAYEVDVTFEDKDQAFYASIDENLVTFGESLDGMLISVFDLGDVATGDPSVPLAVTEGANAESLVVTDFPDTRVLCGLGSPSTLGIGALSILFDAPSIEFGFRTVRSGTGVGIMNVAFFDATGEFVDLFEYNEFHPLPETVAWRGSASNLVSGVVIINFGGSGVCIDDVRFQTTTLMPPLARTTLAPSSTPSRELSRSPSATLSERPSVAPLPSPSRLPSVALSDRPSIAPLPSPSRTPSVKAPSQSQTCGRFRFELLSDNWGISLGYGKGTITFICN